MKPSEQSPSEYAISRIAQEATGTRGWQVRLQRNGVRHCQFFSDAEWGGEMAALEKARQFRDRLVVHTERVVYRRTTVRSQSVVTSRNSSGVVGVSRISQTSSNGNEYHFWQATWSPQPGKRESLRYSVLKYGDDEAFRLACEARETGIGGKTRKN